MLLIRKERSFLRLPPKLLFLGLLLGVLCMQNDGRANQLPARDRKEKEVLQLLKRQADAGIHRDVSVIEQILDTQYFHTNPDGSVMTRAQTLDSYRSPRRFNLSSEELSQVKTIVAAPDLVIVNALVSLNGTKNDAPFTSSYRVTYVLRRRNGIWKVLNSHSSLLSTTLRE